MLITPTADFTATVVPFPVVLNTMRLEEVLGLGEDLADVDLLIVPLIGDRFDAVDVLKYLGATVFIGRVRVVAPRLPDRAMVLCELLSVAGPLGLTVDLSECL